MGKQFEVYLTTNDERGLVEHLQRECHVLIYRTVYFTEVEREVPSLAELGKYPTDQQVGLTAPQFLDSLVTTTFKEGHTRLNLIYSPLIEFGRSEQIGDTIRPGRFWYQLEGLEGKKVDDFKKWASTVFRQVKQKLVPRPSQTESYLGEEAANLVESQRATLAAW